MRSNGSRPHPRLVARASKLAAMCVLLGLVSGGCGPAALGRLVSGASPPRPASVQAQRRAAEREAARAAREPLAIPGKNSPNRKAAEREASHLLMLARLPSGAAQLARAPSPVASGPYMGTPVVGTVVDKSEFWAVPMAYAFLTSWVPAHPPTGLELSGWADGDEAVSYSAKPTPQWQSAELELTQAPLTSSTAVIRVDAIVVWLDPRPLPDGAPGPRVRVDVEASCPRDDAKFVGVANPGADLTTRLLPPGTPRAGLVCTYDSSSPFDSRTGTLTRTAHFGGGDARPLAEAVSRLPLSHTDPSATSCAGGGPTAIVAFSYPGRPDVDLWVDLGGCGGGVANGYIVASGDLGELLRGQPG